MSENIKRILDANEEYSKEYNKKAIPGIKPARRLAILTCMDTRIDPLRFAGLKKGDAHIIRNAGGRASDDAIRSLVLSSRLLGTNEWLVVHHTDCGQENFSNEEVCKLMRDTSDSGEGDFINWLTISDRTQSVKDDVRRIRNHPLVPGDVTIYGFLFEVETGRLKEIISE
ncbi:MAG: carbonic anhydrase [Deltaproteobacteria bacterium]